ncbi:MAG: Helix-turn-helix domain, partial [Verrucomicrobiota bacterium]
LVADRLRALRLRHELTQEEAAELMDLSLRFYQVLESGRKKQIWLETVERAAAAYGLAACDLIGPQLPEHSHVQRLPAESSVHYKRRRRGPYGGASAR